MSWPLDVSQLTDIAAGLLPGLTVTLIVTVIVTPLFVGLGLLLAIARLRGPQYLRWLVTGYVEVVRDTPLLLQLFWLFFALPFLGIQVPPIPTAIAALTLNFGAYASEIFRAGILSIPRGQIEAATVLGLSSKTVMRRIVLPQAAVLIVPQLGNSVVELLKATSLLALITVSEIVFYATRQTVLTRKEALVWLVVAVFYFVIISGANVLVRLAESRTRRFAIG